MFKVYIVWIALAMAFNYSDLEKSRHSQHGDGCGHNKFHMFKKKLPWRT
jgi:hypothetical protein